MLKDFFDALNCKGLWHRKHCYKTCALLWGGIIGLITYLVGNYYYGYQGNYLMYIVFYGIIGGAIYGIIYYQFKHGKWTL